MRARLFGQHAAQAIANHLVWSEADVDHGPRPLTTVAEICRAWDYAADYEVNAFFATDRPPLTEDELAQVRDGAIEVDRTAIWVRDGAVWTSAGVTTGIDMALAMVEEDVGRKVADLIAAHLVLYARRPGYQSQFSDVLVAQSDASDPLAAGIAWARAHLRTATLESLARRTGLSLRTFHRRCLEDLGTTPAKLLEKLRLSLIHI